MKLLSGFALALVLGCASASGGGGTAQTGDRNVITAEEIASVPSANLYDLIEKLRPNMLRSRGPQSLGGPGAPFGTLPAGLDLAAITDRARAEAAGGAR